MKRQKQQIQLWGIMPPREVLQQCQTVRKASTPSEGNTIPMMKWLLAILGTLTITISAGCAINREFSIPGNPTTNYYGIDFYIDWNEFDSGNWSYQEGGTKKQRSLPFGHPDSGYKLFGILTLDFKFKDGRKYHEQIDLRPLIAEMHKTNTIPDLSKTKWGGEALIRITVQSDKLSLVYVAVEIESREDVRQAFLKYHKFPLYGKALK